MYVREDASMNPDDYMEGMLRALVDFEQPDDDPYAEFSPLDYLDELGLTGSQRTSVVEYALAAEFMDARVSHLGNGHMFLCISARILPKGVARLSSAHSVTTSDGVSVQSSSPTGLPSHDVPLVFVSHASADKESFVRELVDRLRGSGIDAWIDEQQLLAGDSLPRLPERIAESDAIVIVLSEAALERPWVRNEIESAVYQHVENEKRIIPILLGGLQPHEIPAALQPLLCVPVQLNETGDVGLEEFDRVVEEVVRAVFKVPRATSQPIGSPPDYITDHVVGHAPVDVELGGTERAVLKEIGESIVRTGGKLVNAEGLVANVGEPAVPDAEILEALEVLDGLSYIEIVRSMTSDPIQQIGTFKVLGKGIVWYFKLFVSQSESMEREIYTALADGGAQGDLRKIIDRTSAPSVLVELIADQLEEENILLVTKNSGPSRYYNVKSMALLKKLARNPRILTGSV